MEKAGQDGTISVVMATYNGARYLTDQLDSIAAQTRVPDELLVVDDGSSDGTLELLTKWARDRLWVHIDRNPHNLGINATFHRLLKESTGTWVFTADQDDIWMPQKIEAMLKRACDAALIFSDAMVIDGDGRLLRPSELSRFSRRSQTSCYSFVYRNFVSGHNMLVTRALIERTPEPPEESVMIYDQWLALSASLHGGVSEVATPLCLHRIHGSNAINNHESRRAAAGAQSRKDRALSRLRRRSNRYAALRRLAGLDSDFDRFVLAAVAGSQNLEHRFWSPDLFFTLWSRHRMSRPDLSWYKSLRRTFEMSLGGRAWTMM